MPSFYVTFRITHPIEFTTVDAETREQAIAQVVAGADAGDEIEVMDARDLTGLTGTAGPSGATGATGSTRTTAASGPTGAR